MRGLYAIIDADFLGGRNLPVLPFAERVLGARPALLQLRAKHLGARDTLALLRALKPLCSSVGTLLFANDRPDLALLGECDGVHVGQSDLPVGDVRRFAPRLQVGVSTHGLGELDAALEQRPDYVAFGPVFATSSKTAPEPVVGLDGLASAAARARSVGVPLVAIGGIGLGEVALVRPHADLVAVISALLPPEGLDGVEQRARALWSP